MTAPSNANTSGLEVVAWDSDVLDTFSGFSSNVLTRKPHVAKTGERVRSQAALVTAASAQAIIDRLKLAIWDGEDLPGAVNAVSVEDCEQFCREAQAQHSAMISRATAAEARADRLAEIASKLDAAIGWLDYPFIDNRTPEAELRQRVGFMMKDAEPHRAALQQETQK